MAPTDRSRARRWPEGWSGPWWLERQRDPRSPGYREVADGDAPSNRSGVDWTRLGALSGAERLLVDGRGYLGAEGAEWGVDWWIGADDRWHVPATDAAVRQGLVGAAPVVQTSMRVPGGDVHHRVAVVAGPTGPRVAVEVVNDSAVPVALALAVRPVTLLGVGAVHRVALDGAVVAVDGVGALLLPEPPSRALLAGAADGDPLVAVTAGGAPAAVDGSVDCVEGLGGIVVVVPIAHRATYRWQMALQEILAAPPRRRSRRRAALPAPSAAAAVAVASSPPAPAPDTDAVARGWTAQVERLVRLDLPASPVTDLLGPVRAHLLASAGVPPAGAGDGGADAAAEVAAAAATAGYGVADPVEILVAATGAGRGDRSLGAALYAVGCLVGLGASAPPVRVVAAVAERLARVASAGPVRLASPGLHAAAALLERAGEVTAAAAARRFAASAVPEPPASVGHPAQRAAAAQTLADAGSTAWFDGLAGLAAIARPTGVWPDALDPGTGAGCGVDGHDPLATARYWSTVRAALLADGVSGVALLPAWPEAWRGAPVEVHQLPSAHGVVSFALRWHGPRPALLWSVDGAAPGLVVRAPGLAPSWSSGDATGEALLPEPAAPGGR